MKLKAFSLFCLFSAVAFQANCQSENLFFKSLGGLNGIVESAQKLWASFSSMDDNINKRKIRDMTIDLHAAIVPVISAKKSIINKIKHQPLENIDIKKEIRSLQTSMRGLQTTLATYAPLIKANGMDAEKLSSDLRIEFSTKLDNLDNLKNLLPNNNQRKEFFITYLESGVNILGGSLLILEKFN